MQTVTVRVLHMAGCPVAPRTIRLVNKIAHGMGMSIAVEQILVDTPEQAQALAFLGSPTVQVRGLDIEPEARSRTDFGLA